MRSNYTIEAIRILVEQQAITVNYKQLYQKVENLENFAERAAGKLEITYERI